RSVVLSNHLLEEITIKDIELDVSEQSGFSFKSQCPEILSFEKSCNIVITWLPTSKGLAQGVLTVQHSGKGGMTQAEIKGTLQSNVVKNATIYPEAVPNKGLLISDKEFIDFGSGIKAESAITITLVNSGSSDLILDDIKLSLEDEELSISETGCVKGVVLKPIEACPLTVAWLPSKAGAILNSLQIVHTGIRGVLVMPIRGIADSSAGSQIADNTGVNGVIVDDGTGEISEVRIKRMLSVYTVSSHSSTRAVINGPAGALVVRDGEDTVISGIRVTVTIVSTGVILSGDKYEVMLVFDRSLRLPNQTVSDAGSENVPVSGVAATASIPFSYYNETSRIAPVTPPPLSEESLQQINP
ncbi:MAG: hypothetical protein KAS59_02415, partial [Alphaproteobacteria bacterium]|nr:hypothetical protein [Alphaproteobacteria bacterium]